MKVCNYVEGLALAAVTLVAALSACAGRVGSAEVAEPRAGAVASVEVENQNFYDARIYLLTSGKRQWLGPVSGHSTEVFQFNLPQHDVRFEVTFVGAGAFITQEITTYDGDELLLVLMPDDHRLRLRR